VSTAIEPKANGAGPATAEPSLPVDSFRQAAPWLRRPFTTNAVKFKIQSDYPGGALVVAYIDARLVMERLNHVCPHLWKHRWGDYDPGKSIVCYLEIDGLERPDVGSGYRDLKALRSDALKRAAVHFGVGVSLYAIPRLYLKVDDGHLRQKGDGGKLRTALTAQGAQFCRERYKAWLEAEGIQAFGDPLDHGDVIDAVGDPAELESDLGADEEVGEGPQRRRTPTSKKRATELVETALAAQVTSEQLSMWLTHKSVDHGEIGSKAKAVEVLRQLPANLADELDRWLEGKGT
jgi:hypothetical protein